MEDKKYTITREQALEIVTALQDKLQSNGSYEDADTVFRDWISQNVKDLDQNDLVYAIKNLCTERDNRKGIEKSRLQSGYTLLHFAAQGVQEVPFKKRNTHLKLCEYLLKRGAHVDPVDLLSRTPLSVACKGGNNQVVELLLQKGASLSTKSKSNEKDKEALTTPLIHACGLGQRKSFEEEDLETVKILLNRGADRSNLIRRNGMPWKPKPYHNCIHMLISSASRVQEVQNDHPGQFFT